MSDEEALLAAIIVNPDEVTPLGYPARPKMYLPGSTSVRKIRNCSSFGSTVVVSGSHTSSSKPVAART